MEILQFHVRTYMALTRLATTTDLLEQVRLEGWATENSSSVVKEKVLPGLREDCLSAGMELAVMQIDKAIAATTPQEFVFAMKELESRIYDYMASRTVFIIPAGQSEHYDNPRAGWEDCIEKFHPVMGHVEEAGRCLALGRNTACVYHLCGVAQEALEALGKHLSVPIDPYSDTWNTLLTNIKMAIDKRLAALATKQERKAREGFYSEMLSDVTAMKNAWRNPTMHFRRTYEDWEAKKIYERVREFMRHAAKELGSNGAENQV